MFIKHALSIAFAAVLSIGGSCQASVLTVYYNQADWEAAVAGLEIGPYTGGASETDYLTTISSGGERVCPPPSIDFCILSTSVETFPNVGFSSFHKNFTFPDSCVSCTRPTDVTITFDQPIMGFAAVD